MIGRSTWLLLASLAWSGVPFAFSQGNPEKPAATQTNAGTPDDDEAPPPAEDARKKKFRKSRFSRDETEMRADRRDVVLNVGEDRIIDLDFDLKSEKYVSSGNEAIVRPQTVAINDQRRQIILKPLKKGETNVSIRDDAGNVKVIFHVIVVDSNLLVRSQELKELLRDIEGVEMRVIGQKIVVDGEILVPADYGRLVAILSEKVYADHVINLTVVSPIALQVIADRIQKELRAFTNKEQIVVRVVNGMIFLEGEVDSKAQFDRCASIATAYLPEVAPANLSVGKDAPVTAVKRNLIQNFLNIKAPAAKKQEKLVRVTIHFVELAKSYGKVFGFKWEPSFTSAPQLTVGQNADGGVGADSSNFSFVLSNLLPKLQSAQNAGFARVLKSGTVITRSGQAASFEDNRNFTILGIGQNGVVTPNTQKVGFTANLTPQILGQSEDIALDVGISQENLIGRSAASIDTAGHKVNTKLYVKSGESAAIVGINTADVSTSFNKDDPGGAGEGASPLFSLLRSKQYAKQKGQFVIFVTPQIVENASDGSEDLKKNFRLRVK